MAKSKMTREQKALAVLKEYSGHIIFALFGTYMVLLGISMIEADLLIAQSGVPNPDWKMWSYGTTVFGSMILGGVLAQVALLRNRKKGKNG